MKGVDFTWIKDWWPAIATLAAAGFTLLVVRLRAVFATRAQLEGAELRIKALEERNARRQGLLEKALNDFERRTDSLAGKNDLADCLKAVGDAHHRIDLLDKDVKALPTTGKLDTLSERVAQISGDLRAMAEKVNGLDDKVGIAVAGVQRVEDWLQESKR